MNWRESLGTPWEETHPHTRYDPTRRTRHLSALLVLPALSPHLCRLGSRVLPLSLARAIVRHGYRHLDVARGGACVAEVCC